MTVTIDKNRDYSASALGKNYRVRDVEGVSFLAEDLVALYDMKGGSVGQGFFGPYPDLSGNGHEGLIYGDRAAPIQRAEGLEVADLNGLVVTTGIPATLTQYTVVVGARMRTAAQTTNPENTDAAISQLAHHLFGSTMGTGTTKGGNHTVAGTAIGFSVNQNRVYQRDPSAWISGVPRDYLVAGAGQAGQNIIMTREVDGPGGSVRLSTLSDPVGILHTNASNGDTRITDRFDGGDDTGFFAWGAWPNALVRPTASPTVDLFFVALYAGVLDADRKSKIQAAGALLMQNRGLAVLGL